ncbi:alpha/beta hydrolase [Agromyces rhizosphaerae]|uniref:Alpha/beta hydrolase n=1 Tax=Agromyces rhizosphaerae TaxID=88374 RepID=A0A9W6CVY8_9MICO|nr:alpha/beta fold hydrolase [Agromyces rhizosphaerae]GLI27370.1 alpha/beta hydrolase [Agromyces rhizosphaerae]
MTALTAIATATRSLAAVSPAAGSALALRLFLHVGRRMPLADRDRAIMDQARRSTVRVRGIDGRGTDVVAYEWGSGDDVVLLVHGWQGRASQFGAMVRELRAEGFRVVAFDAPAHGESDGSGAYVIDWVDAIHELQHRYGRFDAIIAHSFGALGVFTAIAEGVTTRRVMTVSSPADADAVFSEFGGALGLDARTLDAMRERFVARLFAGEADPFARVSAIHHPLPDTVDLLVAHDPGDRRVSSREAERLLAAHPRARHLSADGAGHTRILRDDAVLDAMLGFVGDSRQSAASVDAVPARAATTSA